ncbi:MAG: CapA family protein, partial [Myxococcales bacterium]|nr:CapA family protein [Myxococcales bacterium]
LPPDDGATLLAAVTPLLQDADLTFVNLEGPLCDGGTTRKCRPDSEVCYAFRTPTRYGRHLQAAGVDLASTANNHAGDFGQTCREQTEATLDALGIAWSGPPGTIGTATAGPFRVALVAFHTSRSSNYVNDHAQAAELVAAAQATHDLVVVSFHGGAEGSGALHVPDEMELFHEEERGHLRAFARAVVAAGADVVIGHGPHVPRGMEIVDGHLVAYSLGNFATYGRFNLSGHLGTSLVLEVVLDDAGRLVQGRILPVRQRGRGVPEPDEEGRAIALVRSLSQEDFPTTAPVIAADGSFVPRP